MAVEMDEPSDCIPCRLISGVGFIGFGLYIGLVGTKNSRSSYSRFAVAVIGVGFAGVGFARLLGLPPFSKKKKIESSET